MDKEDILDILDGPEKLDENFCKHYLYIKKGLQGLKSFTVDDRFTELKDLQENGTHSLFIGESVSFENSIETQGALRTFFPMVQSRFRYKLEENSISKNKMKAIVLKHPTLPYTLEFSRLPLKFTLYLKMNGGENK